MKKIQLFISIKKNNFDSFRPYNDRFFLTFWLRGAMSRDSVPSSMTLLSAAVDSFFMSSRAS